MRFKKKHEILVKNQRLEKRPQRLLCALCITSAAFVVTKTLRKNLFEMERLIPYLLNLYPNNLTYDN